MNDDKLREAYRQYAASALEHADKVMSFAEFQQAQQDLLYGIAGVDYATPESEANGIDAPKRH